MKKLVVKWFFFCYEGETYKKKYSPADLAYEARLMDEIREGIAECSMHGMDLLRDLPVSGKENERLFYLYLKGDGAFESEILSVELSEKVIGESRGYEYVAVLDYDVENACHTFFSAKGKADLMLKQRQECLERLRILGVLPNVRKEFKEEQKLNCSEYYGALFWLTDEVKEMVRGFEEKYDAMVYHVVKSRTEFGDAYAMLYVSKDADEWESDREYLKTDGEAIAYVVNGEVAEIGSIGVRPQYGGVVRTW